MFCLSTSHVQTCSYIMIFIFSSLSGVVSREVLSTAAAGNSFLDSCHASFLDTNFGLTSSDSVCQTNYSPVLIRLNELQGDIETAMQQHSTLEALTFIGDAGLAFFVCVEK